MWEGEVGIGCVRTSSPGHQEFLFVNLGPRLDQETTLRGMEFRAFTLSFFLYKNEKILPGSFLRKKGTLYHTDHWLRMGHFSIPKSMT